ncbi:MAG: ABC transporter ATP-binding protein [Planctomycetota bacterium]|nr:ABC transporter ATP-binding protein [Planctomycetota bacterium]
MADVAIQVDRLYKSYQLGRVDLHVLRGVTFHVAAGEFAAVVGASGSGKSTMLHLAGLLDRPDRGQIRLLGQDAASLSSGARNRMRCRDIGFVFQFYHLLPELNVLQNVLLPARVDAPSMGWLSRRRAVKKRAREILDRLGLDDRLMHRPTELSGGERQRVALARAMINRPKILLADEPTGNLDSKAGKGILDLLRELNRRSGQTTLMVTHDLSLAEQADRILHLSDGRIV